mgnify:CR=1 FL=1
MNQPINRTQEAKNAIQENIYVMLTKQLDLILIGLDKRGIVSDPVGILENNYVLSNHPKLPTSNVLPILIKRLLSEREKDIPMARLTAAQKAANAKKEAITKEAATANATVVETKTVTDTTVKPDVETSTVVTKTPAKEVVLDKTVLAEAIQEELDQIAETDINYSFHTPYIDKVTEVLSVMNNQVESDPEFTANVGKLKNVVRTWINNFYQNIISSSNQDKTVSYITKDVHGILDGNTPFSDPIYLDYDHAYLLEEIFITCQEKFKVENGKEVSVHTMAKGFIDLQDPSKPIVSLDTDTKGKESIVVDKENGNVAIKKDNIIVRIAKGAWTGFKNFCTNVKNMFVRFWNWVTSWFKSEKKVIISETEYKELQTKGLAAA